MAEKPKPKDDAPPRRPEGMDLETYRIMLEGMKTYDKALRSLAKS